MAFVTDSNRPQPPVQLLLGPPLRSLPFFCIPRGGAGGAPQGASRIVAFRGLRGSKNAQKSRTCNNTSHNGQGDLGRQAESRRAIMADCSESIHAQGRQTCRMIDTASPSTCETSAHEANGGRLARPRPRIPSPSRCCGGPLG